MEAAPLSRCAAELCSRALHVLRARTGPGCRAPLWSRRGFVSPLGEREGLKDGKGQAPPGVWCEVCTVVLRARVGVLKGLENLK